MSDINNPPPNTSETTNDSDWLSTLLNENMSRPKDVSVKKNFAEYVLNGKKESPPPISPLVRSTHRDCDNHDFCGMCVSCYSHNYCFICCYPKKDSKEYLYHYSTK